MPKVITINQENRYLTFIFTQIVLIHQYYMIYLL